MGMKKCCDVFGTTDQIKTYSLQLKCDDDSTITKSLTADLGERALARLMTKMNNGTTPPAKRKSK